MGSSSRVSARTHHTPTLFLGVLVVASLKPSLALAEGDVTDEAPVTVSAATSTETPALATAEEEGSVDAAQAAAEAQAEPEAVRGVRKEGWWGGWGAVGGALYTGRDRASWSLAVRGDANPMGVLLVSGKLRYVPGVVDTDAMVGLLFSRDFEAQGIETWKTKSYDTETDELYKHYGSQATIRTEWALAGGGRVFHFGDGISSHTDFILQAGFERLRANSHGNRYTTSLRALYNPAEGKWGGAVTWMYANPPTWRFVYGIEAGLLPTAGKSPIYVTLDVGIALGN